MLHGEQYLEVVDDLPVEGTVTTSGRVIDVTDKKSGAVVVADCNINMHFFPYPIHTITINNL